MEKIIETLKQILQGNSNKMCYSDLFDKLKQEYPAITENEYEEILAQHTDIFRWQQIKQNNITIEDRVSLPPMAPPAIPNQQNNPNIDHLPGKVMPLPPNQNDK